MKARNDKPKSAAVQLLDGVEAFARRNWFYFALLFIILIALWYRAQPLDNFLIPTWGNTMYHVGIERAMIETQHYPAQELSYGGGFPNFYVPGYRLLVASLAIATGIDVMVMSGLIVPVLGVFILLAFYAVGYRMSGGNAFVGLFAAFFFLLSPDITVNTVRPFPELMGLFVLPMALYFIVREDWPLAILMAVLMAVTHQQSMLALFGIIGIYAFFQFVNAALKFKMPADRKLWSIVAQFEKPLWCLTPALTLGITYAVWQMFTVGSLNLLKIAQIQYHEQWPVSMSTIIQTGLFVLLFLVPGAVYFFWPRKSASSAAVSEKKPDSAAAPEPKGYSLNVTADVKLMMVAWIVSSIILTKNELLPFNVMNTLESRFYTYFVEAAIILAAFGMYAFLSWIDLKLLLETPE